MKNDRADITVVVDRSGSMMNVREEAQNGINHLIKEQQQQQGQANFTLVQFDTEYEFVHNGTPMLAVAANYELVPRGWTALFDAVGRAIIETGKRLAVIPEADRPGLVVMAIVTDGQENSSKEFKKEQIKAMIEEQRTKYAWKFLFLGANQDAFKEAADMGISMAAAANFTDADKAYRGVSNKMSNMRAEVKTSGFTSDSLTDAEREAIEAK